MSWSKIFEPCMHQSSGTSPSIVVGISRNMTCTATFGPPRVLFEEDFSEGIPSTWQVVDGGYGGGAAGTWTTANPGNRNFGPPFVEPFAIVDSDAAGPGATQDEQLITPSISVEPCPGNPRKVFISFSDYMRGLERERADVALSVDGTSWVRKEGFDDPALEVDSYRCRGVGMAAQGSVGPCHALCAGGGAVQILESGGLRRPSSGMPGGCERRHRNSLLPILRRKRK